MTLAQTFTAVAEAGPVAQIVAAIVAGLLLSIPLAFGWARSKIAKATAIAEAERLEAEARLEDARRLAYDSQRIKARLISSVAAGLDVLTDEARKRVTSTMKAATGDLETEIDAEVKAVRKATEEREAVGADGEPASAAGPGEAPKP